jgi:hypothetical protein
MLKFIKPKTDCASITIFAIVAIDFGQRRLFH